MVEQAHAPRIIPALLLRDTGLFKGVRFKNHKYVGDPMNAVRIFNAKNADELMLLDIGATAAGRAIDVDFVRRVADECYMPFGVGGGISSVDQIGHLVRAGAEKVVLNTSALRRPGLVREAAEAFGRQCVVVAMDVGRDWRGRRRVVAECGRRATTWEPVEWARRVEDEGAGEILLTSIEREGTGTGYDVATISAVAGAVSVPVIASGGAGSAEDFSAACAAGASAAAAGSVFVFTGAHRSVLIQYFNRKRKIAT